MKIYLIVLIVLSATALQFKARQRDDCDSALEDVNRAAFEAYAINNPRNWDYEYEDNGENAYSIWETQLYFTDFQTGEETYVYLWADCQVDENEVETSCYFLERFDDEETFEGIERGDGHPFWDTLELIYEYYGWDWEEFEN